MRSIQTMFTHHFRFIVILPSSIFTVCIYSYHRVHLYHRRSSLFNFAIYINRYDPVHFYHRTGLHYLYSLLPSPFMFTFAFISRIAIPSHSSLTWSLSLPFSAFLTILHLLFSHLFYSFSLALTRSLLAPLILHTRPNNFL